MYVVNGPLLPHNTEIHHDHGIGDTTVIKSIAAKHEATFGNMFTVR